LSDVETLLSDCLNLSEAKMVQKFGHESDVQTQTQTQTQLVFKFTHDRLFECSIRTKIL